MGRDSSQEGRRSLLLLVTVAAMVAGFAALAGSASAAPPVLWTGCETGSEAGQCKIPRGIAADPADGHVFIADMANQRIVELNARGEFVKAWGWGVDTGIAELETCTAESGCQTGLEGSGTGQFSFPLAIAVDSAGNVYVSDFFSPRVQKYDRDGNFVWMIGGEVNKTKVESGTASEAEENLCTAVSGDACQKGTQGTGQGQFGAFAIGDIITVDRKGTGTDADDVLYVGEVGRIQEFDIEGAYLGEIALPGETVQSLAVDSAGDLYTAYAASLTRTKDDVRKIDPASGELEAPRFEIEEPKAVAVSAAGRVFVFGPIQEPDGGSVIPLDPIVEFDAGGNRTDSWGKGEFNGSTGLETNLCAGSEAPGNVYVANSNESNSFVRAYGTEPIGCLKARTLPATDITETTATLNGAVNPKGEAVTDCFFEWGTSTAYGQTASCVPAAGSIGTGSDPVPVEADLSGLQKGTVYHFRLVAEVGGETELGADESFKTLGPPVISDAHTVGATHDEATVRALVNPEGFATTYVFQYTTETAFKASGGFEGAQSTTAIDAGSDRSEHAVQAVLGNLAPDTAYVWRIIASNFSGGDQSEPLTFATYRPFGADTGCPNQALRGGPSAFLPDCRAYEMVSPVDKNGGDILTAEDGYPQVSSDGEKITYTAGASFAGQPAALGVTQYLADRDDVEGWSTKGIQIPVTGELVGFAAGLGQYFGAFTPDLCAAWQADLQNPPVTTEGQEGRGNPYRQVHCGVNAGALEALVPDPPALPESANFEGATIQGVSDDSRLAVFFANAALPHAPEANPGGNQQIYVRFCPLAPAQICRADTPGARIAVVSIRPDGSADASTTSVGSGSVNSIDNAVSANGSRVYWTSNINQLSGEGTIFQRRHPEQGKVDEECSVPEVACTTAVSGVFPAFFWAASEDGARAVYSESSITGDEGLFEFREGQPKRMIAADVVGVAGAADDLSRIYFVSRAALAAGATAGEPNLYLDEEGTKSFVATLAEDDVLSQAELPYSVVERNHKERATRVSPDGATIAFQSRADLLADFESEGAVQVFRYEAGGELSCVSCNPSGARPATAPLLAVQFRRNGPSDIPAAAWIPSWQQPLHPSHVLSDDGNRLFFNAHDALLPRDNNNAQDVYEWEAAGSGGCTTASPSYFEKNDGCLYLISTGESSFESEFWEASPDGRDVFFSTGSTLVPRDPGSVDLYDARAGGGIPRPVEPAPCEGEACQNPPAPPDFPDPASSAYSGPGNVSASRRCARPARRAAALSRRAKRLRRQTKSAGGPAARQVSRRARRLGNRAAKLSRKAKRCRRAAGNASPSRSCTRPARRAAALSGQAKRLRRQAKSAGGPDARQASRQARRLGNRAAKLSREAKRCRRAAR